VFSDSYNEWAWGEGEKNFPAELFEAGNEPSIYFKYKISSVFNSLLQEKEIVNNNEIDLLRKIHPHSIITTNYDKLLESIYPEFTPIIGQKILYANHGSIGEILKIHGCCSNPKSIIINRDDYDDFIKKKKYLSAKLLTFFAEHPLLFIGYSAEDSNIKNILSDIDELLSENGDVIPNIYILEWTDKQNENEYPRRERLIQVSANKSIRIKSIVANDFSWVFSAFGANRALDNINPKLLRALLARTYDLVRTDIPRNPVQVDYRVLSSISESEGELAKLYGIATSSDGMAFNASYPFTLTTLGQSLGFKGWHDANKLLEIVKNITGVDIKTFDNKYHYAIMNGDEIQSHRYSNYLRELLEKVRNGEEFDLGVKAP
ncbi:SIR2 family protein, partial [Salmonella enterica subsp. enterica serovar Worthington]|nr:SIR2 family protein [Salmonella enterica subsp. enterica serovar Worthington]